VVPLRDYLARPGNTTRAPWHEKGRSLAATGNLWRSMAINAEDWRETTEVTEFATV
jgi:hypothetical protein